MLLQKILGGSRLGEFEGARMAVSSVIFIPRKKSAAPRSRIVKTLEMAVLVSCTSFGSPIRMSSSTQIMIKTGLGLLLMNRASSAAAVLKPILVIPQAKHRYHCLDACLRPSRDLWSFSFI